MQQVSSLRKSIIGVLAVLVCVPVLICSVSGATIQRDQSATTQPTTGKATPKAEMIERLINYYAEMYGKHLKSKDWMARTMAVISLARIDDPRTTGMLMDVMIGDKKRIVRVYAWEAIHARQDRLTPEQRNQWVESAFKLAKKNSFRGDLRLGLVGLLKTVGPTAGNKKIFKKLFTRTNSNDPNDIRTLWAMGDALKRWKSPDLIKWLINSMDKLDSAYRAELILRRVHSGIPRASSLWKTGSDAMWETTKERWVEWFKQAGLEEINPPEGSPYAGLSRVMPRGEKITKARDAKWRKDMELRRCRLGRLEVCFVVDSTGSMGSAVRWIQRDVVKMMRAFEKISREPRIGVILYRDHGDEYVVQSVPLLGNARRLASALRNASAKGGGDIPEAVYEALYTAVKKQKWSKSSNVRKVIILVGDAPPHKETLEKIERLVTSAVKRGFSFYCIKVRTRYRHRSNYDSALKTFDKIAEWGGGRSLWMRFTRDGRSGGRRTASPQGKDDSGRILLSEVLKAVLEKGYSDRVDPFIGVLLEYVEKPVKEKRHSFGPWKEPVRPSKPAKPRKPTKPRDPQAR